MAAILKKLYTENGNPFQLSLHAGQNSIRNVVTWVYIIEDEYLIPYFYGSELAVTTGFQMTMNPSWLMTLIRQLAERRAAGLIVNVGKYVPELPQEIIDYCNAHDFPLFTMPWEIHITDMVKEFCMRIINEQYESQIHDQAVRDIISNQGNPEELREILGRYYDLSGRFCIILIYIRSSSGEDLSKVDNLIHLFSNRLRHFKTTHNLKEVKIGLIPLKQYELMLLNNLDSRYFTDIRNIILEVYREAYKAKTLFIGAGIEVSGIEELYKSFHRAQTAMRMAVYRNMPYVHFEEMGFYKILFSVKDDELLYSYANEILAPLDTPESVHHHYLELLKIYIENDRSLEKTAAAMYLHRNTVNYRIQKMKALLNNPLRTLEDLFPYQVALAIRDMENHKIQSNERTF